MLYKSKLTLITLIFSFTSVFSQESAIYNAMKKKNRNVNDTKSMRMAINGVNCFIIRLYFIFVRK